MFFLHMDVSTTSNGLFVWMMICIHSQTSFAVNFVCFGSSFLFLVGFVGFVDVVDAVRGLKKSFIDRVLQGSR